MLEDHIKSPVLRRRLRASLVAPHVDAFADWLARRSHTPITIAMRLRSLASWAVWMEAHGLAIVDTEAGMQRLATELAAGRVRHARGPNGNSLQAVRHFLAFLREQGVVAALAVDPPLAERMPIVVEFRQWMSRNRGLRDSSLNHYQRVVVDLVGCLGEEASLSLIHI